MRKIVTKLTDKEHDTRLLQNLLLDLVKKQHSFRKVDCTETHGQLLGQKMRGQSELGEYRKAKKSYDFNYARAEKKYTNVYDLVAPVMSECQKYLI